MTALKSPTLSALTRKKVKLQKELADIENEITDSKQMIQNMYTIETTIKLNIFPIKETGGSKTGTLNMSYDGIIEKVGKPNVTKMDDPDKVKASWGFQDSIKRKGFIWSYNVPSRNVKLNKFWSTDGDKYLLTALFGNAYIYEG